MKIRLNRKIILIAVLYAALVFISENTLGNPDFPIHFWIFTTMPAWQWSVPVHFSGFLWIVFWNVKLKEESIVWAVVACLMFFFSAELLNRHVFHFFIYSRQPLGEDFSFWVVIGLYVGLCAICSLFLRDFDRPQNF